MTKNVDNIHENKVKRKIRLEKQLSSTGENNLATKVHSVKKEYKRSRGNKGNLKVELEQDLVDYSEDVNYN